jgi:hypothetical protein
VTESPPPEVPIYRDPGHEVLTLEEFLGHVQSSAEDVGDTAANDWIPVVVLQDADGTMITAGVGELLTSVHQQYLADTYLPKMVEQFRPTCMGLVAQARLHPESPDEVLTVWVGNGERWEMATAPIVRGRKGAQLGEWTSAAIGVADDVGRVGPMYPPMMRTMAAQRDE